MTDTLKIPDDLIDLWHEVVFFGEHSGTQYRPLIERVARAEQERDTLAASYTKQAAEYADLLGRTADQNTLILALKAQVSRLTEVLGNFYDLWENGTQVLEAEDDGTCIEGTNLGNAVKLSFEMEQSILNLIVLKCEEWEQPCANCQKPYRAHLLHDHNKCTASGDVSWFPGHIAAAIIAARAAKGE
jgi:hypothetical protein